MRKPDRQTVEHLTVAMQQCVIASNEHFEAGRFDDAKQWHELAVDFMQQLEALTGQPYLATRESA